MFPGISVYRICRKVCILQGMFPEIVHPGHRALQHAQLYAYIFRFAVSQLIRMQDPYKLEQNCYLVTCIKRSSLSLIATDR